MTEFTIKKSDLSVEGYFTRPAFNLLRPDTDLHGTITTMLSDFCPIRGGDIRIDQDTSPIGNAHVIYELRPFNGVGRISLDRAQLACFSPHLIDSPTITALTVAFLNAVHEAVTENSYETFLVQFTFHAELKGSGPAAHISQFVTPVPEGPKPAIGNSVTYYFGQDEPRTHSSVTVDMSGEFSECVFVRAAVGYAGDKITTSALPEPLLQHCDELLSLVGLESEQ